MADAVTVTCS